MKKRMLSLLLALVLVIGLLPVTAHAGQLDNGLVYEVYADHVEITDYSGDAAEVVIPAEIEGLPVTVIGKNAFEWGTMTSLSMPDSVTEIGPGAFNMCESLDSIDLSDNITTIGNGAFRTCSLPSIDLPDSVTSIGKSAFAYCYNLTSISIPDSVTEIGSYAFNFCESLTSIDLPDGITSIDEGTFQWCASLPSISIPDSVTSIGDYAFADCYSLESISIPDGVTFIGESAFFDCESLTSIYFEGDAPWIAEDAFSAFMSTIIATAYYPAENPTWTADVMQGYGGEITWVPHTPNPFTDVPAGAFYEKPVLWAVEKGITNGTSADKFGSFDVCNRAAVVTFLWRAAGSPDPESTDNPFVDVKDTDFFYKPVLWAIENGVTNGVDATHFGPTTACNRTQVVTFLYRAFN